MRIKLLEPLLANQIAAGEVVERPASVLKELLENSIDAGASKIEIEIAKGGIELIRVTDNGCGIHKDDLQLALSRHATSKIHNLHDLENIYTLGFRGEALASISSISRLTLTSTEQNQTSGWKISAEGRESDLKSSPASHPAGTTIEVRDLFFNTPARRKFLRTEKTEFNHIEELVKRIALSRFDIEITLTHNQQQIYKLKAITKDSERYQRVEKICGKAFLEESLYVETEATGLKLNGWLGLPSFLRNQTDMQYFYVNGRIIRDKLIHHAIRQAFQDRLYEGKNPAYVLYLALDPYMVDINVHPTKHEVRFRESRLVHDFIFSSLTKALNHDDATDLNLPQPSNHHVEEIPPQPKPTNYQYQHQNMRDFARHLQEQQKLYKPNRGPATTPPAPIKYKDITLFKNQFLLLEGQEALVIVDLEIFLKAKIMKYLLHALETDAINTKPLLMPQSFSFDKKQQDCIETQAENLAKLGIDLSSIDQNTLLIRKTPDLESELVTLEYEAFLKDLTASLSLEDIIKLMVKHLRFDQDVVINPVEKSSLLKLLQEKSCQQLSYGWKEISVAEIKKFYL